MAAIAEYPLTWDLESLLPAPEAPDFQRILERFREELAQLAARSDALPAVSSAPDVASQWADFVSAYERLDAQAADLTSFIACQAAADAENRLYQQLEARLASLQPLRERIATNVEFALKSADDATFARFAQAHARLGSIAFFLSERRENAKLRLPKDQELLAADLAVDGIHAWGRLYDRISGELRVQVMERGELVEKSPGQVQFDSPQRAVRENNFYASDKAWGRIADTCADALNHISGTRLTIYKRLGLEDHLVAPLRYNRLQRRTLETMWSVVTQRKGVLARYLERKAELLGLKKLTWYDLQAPLVRGKVGSSELSYAEACRLIIETFSRFSSELGDFARDALERGWVEAENRSGKRQGGFCTGFPTHRQSRIFMTFTNTADSMSTLAHELGHAYHSYVLRDQPLFLQDYPMNLAETASTFAEAVLNERRLDDCESADEQLEILDTLLSDSVAFLMNIHARFIFEDNLHRERAGGELSSERCCELMQAAQQEAYLDSLADDGWYPRFWVSKLHFYISSLPFYNFPYTFGYLLSLGVYAAARQAGDDFAGRYRELLIATGCKRTEEAVQSTLGYDLTNPTFWNNSLNVVEEHVDRFLALAN